MADSITNETDWLETPLPSIMQRFSTCVLIERPTEEFLYIQQVLFKINLLDLIMFYKGKYIYANLENELTNKYEDWLEENLPSSEYHTFVCLLDLETMDSLGLEKVFSHVEHATVVSIVVAFKQKSHSLLFKLALA